MTTSTSSAAKTIIGWSILTAAAALAGVFTQSVGLPGGWLVGPMIISVAFALTWPQNLALPRGTRRASQAVIGGTIAAAFRPSVLPLIAKEWLAVSLAVTGTLLFSLGASLLLTRLTRLDAKTATLGTLPGGASGMLAMSGSMGADPRLVALMQYTRVVLVVAGAALVGRFSPAAKGTTDSRTDLSLESVQVATLDHNIWLAYGLTALVAVVGAWCGLRLKLPAGALLGPLMLGIAFEELGVLHLAWPPGVPQAAYAALGVYVGLLFDQDSIKRAGRILPFIVAFTVGLIAACAGLGWILAALTGTDGLTAYFATTPGGMDTVAIIALGSGAEVSLVLAVQMLRLLTVLLIASLLGQRWS